METSLEEKSKNNRIVICSSTRFNDYIELLASKLEKYGNDVKIPSDVPFPKSKSIVEQTVNKINYEIYIKNADLILVFNGNDYVGFSTIMEIGISLALKKEIKILFPTNIDELKILSHSPANKLKIDTEYIKKYLDKEIVDKLDLPYEKLNKIHLDFLIKNTDSYLSGYTYIRTIPIHNKKTKEQYKTPTIQMLDNIKKIFKDWRDFL